MEWVTLSAGLFTMGISDEEAHQLSKDYGSNVFFLETPQRTVYLEEFEISKYPVTNTQYQEFMEATGHPAASPYIARHSHEQNSEFLDHPVAWVSWYDAYAYCLWAKCRLPTEAEWERAARGLNGYRYPWGNDWRNNYCNTVEANIGITTPVGRYPTGASSEGVFDMSGNVWEWTDSWHITDTIAPKQMDKEAAEHKLKENHQIPVLRGGGVNANRVTARCTYRHIKYMAWDWGDWVGFRCVKLKTR